MSRSGRIITALQAERKQIEAFPYYAADFSPETEPGDAGDDTPIGSTLSTPEEDAHRLASVDQIIHEKLQAAEQQAQDIAQRAYEEGFASGEAEGRTFGESQFKAYMQRLDGNMKELSATMTLLNHASRDEILAMAMAMGEYLAGQQIERSPQSVAPLLEAILEANPFPGPEGTQGAIQAFLNPKDLESFKALDPTMPGIRFQEDQELSRGSLRLEAADGILDATVERRMKRLLELIEQSREKDLLS
ncbi:flagellar assembly protein FliH [Holophaga foetida]|uniref:FliH/SctL family protein n=1 Tax=Holophaga foetida TaxID=35839 RepID=UPI00024742E2|nr:flagellar assembly protein FliH [Holophaga foetida]